jgi:serine/threonine protein phosphatase PrpC
LVLAASVGGASHRWAGRRCEDSFGWALPEPGHLALVVADGVGSAGRGGEGAELAVEAACRYLGGSGASGWGPARCRAAISEASDALYRSGGEAPAELATTIVVALLRASAGRAEVTLGRVGDSSAFVLLPGGEWQELFGVAGATGDGQLAGAEAADEGDGALLLTATVSLPLPSPQRAQRPPPGAPGRAEADTAEAGTGEADTAEAGTGEAGTGEAGRVELVSAELGRGAALVLLTDGVAQPLRDGPTTVAPGLAEALRCGREGELGPLGLAGAVDFSRRGAHDDRTVLVAWPLVGEG